MQPLRIEDADDLAALLFDAAIYRFIGGQPDSVESLAGRYRQLAAAVPPDESERWLNWVVRDRASGATVGTVQATLRDSWAMVAWIIGVKFQGRGFAREAATALVEWLPSQGVDAVEAHVHPDHGVSAAVAAAAGLAPTAEIVEGEIVWRRRFDTSRS